MSPAAQELLHLRVVAQEAHIERIRPIKENESQGQVAPALKKMAAEFADAHASVNMRTAKGFAQIAQFLQTLGTPALGQLSQPFHHLRIKGERFFQAIP
jgi:hypothetical protein